MTQLSTTYQETAKAYLETTNYSDIEKNAINEFAHHLDGFAVLDDKMQILAYQKAREIDRETILALFDFIKENMGEEMAKAVVRKVVENHKHTKVESKEVEGGVELSVK